MLWYDSTNETARPFEAARSFSIENGLFCLSERSTELLQFLHHLIDPTAVTMLFIMLYALSVHIAPSIPTRTTSLLWLICWVVVAVAAFIAWIVLTFS